MPTIGVAIAIPEPWASQLQDYRASIGDATAETIPTHITLVPPTDVDDASSRWRPTWPTWRPSRRGFVVHLRGTGTFRPVSPVVFVTLVEGISQCEQLAAAVRRGPLAMELAFPTTPTSPSPTTSPTRSWTGRSMSSSTFECTFAVTDFHLYVHDDEAAGSRPASFALRPRRR